MMIIKDLSLTLGLQEIFKDVNLQIGDKVKAGQIIGTMGDSGYGSEGTVGKFPVHLHFGVYLDIDGEEQSVNPYWILKYLESNSSAR